MPPPLEEQALLEILRTHEFLQQRLTAFFRRFQLTPTQYNLLRILRGAGPAGITCSQASERMVTADPDITRLLARLESRRFILRQRAPADRRVILTSITREGLDLLKTIDKPLSAFLRQSLSRVTPGRLRLLVETLESIRTS